MFSTFLFVTIFAGLLIALLVLWALFLRVGLRWANVPDVSTRRIILVTALVSVLHVVMNVLFHSVSLSFDDPSILFTFLEIAAAVVVPCVVIGIVFNVRFVRAVQAWLPTLLASVITLAFALLVIRPLLYETFLAPTNAMAPTLVGQHWKGTCPKCGELNYGSPRDDRYGLADPAPMICDNFHVTEASHIDKTIHAGDRFLVAKFLEPRRWDLVVFRYPEQPTKLYVKRLVGLPGEEIHIQDGSVWVDGTRQTPPDSLRGIEYLSELPVWFGDPLWGSPTHPASLGSDEYFVLGDFSAQSEDSRLWQRGAPGHPPYAVPESYLKGVVTHTFWPLDRLRIHR